MNKLLLAVALCAAASAPAWAEKGDSEKPTVIDADFSSGTNVRQMGNLEGNVVLTRGTLIMKAGRAAVKEDPEGYQFVTFWAAPGTLATFRQKRDGGDLWVEGQAERIEYDGKLEIVKLFSKAKVTQLDGSKITDEAEGPFISYDTRNENFLLANTATGESKPGAGRVHMVLQHANKGAPAKPAPAAPAAAPAKPALTPPAAPATKAASAASGKP